MSGMAGVSSLMNSWAIKTVAKDTAAAVKTLPFVALEEPVDSNTSESRSAADNVEALRFKYSLIDLPPFALAIVTPGNWSGGGYGKESSADLARGDLTRLVKKYLEEIKDDFGCSSDTSYMPYMPGLPEYDRGVEAAMKKTLYAKIENDPEAERLIRAMGGVFPPPQSLNFDTMCYGAGAGGMNSPWAVRDQSRYAP